MAKYKNAYREELENEEETYSEAFKREEEERRKKENPDGDLPEATTPEEQTFKKRYSDLRRHSQKQNEQIKKLEERLDELSKGAATTKLPKTEQEVEAWMKKYPEASAYIDTIARKRALEMKEEFQTTSSKLDELREEIAKEKAFAELLRRHPDFNDIRQSEEFNTWVDARYERNENDWVWRALFENDTDVDAASEAIDYYKAVTAKSATKEKRPTNKDAARNVSVRAERTEPKSTSEMKFSESQIERESRRDKTWYERHEEQIMDAFRKGEVEMDITGGAR